jgi:hypothetical protein
VAQNIAAVQSSIAILFMDFSFSRSARRGLAQGLYLRVVRESTILAPTAPLPNCSVSIFHARFRRSILPSRQPPRGPFSASHDSPRRPVPGRADGAGSSGRRCSALAAASAGMMSSQSGVSFPSLRASPRPASPRCPGSYRCTPKGRADDRGQRCKVFPESIRTSWGATGAWTAAPIRLGLYFRCRAHNYLWQTQTAARESGP